MTAARSDKLLTICLQTASFFSSDSASALRGLSAAWGLHISSSSSYVTATAETQSRKYTKLKHCPNFYFIKNVKCRAMQCIFFNVVAELFNMTEHYVTVFDFQLP